MVVDICLVLAIALLAFIVVKLSQACAALAQEVDDLCAIVFEMIEGPGPDGGTPVEDDKVVRLDTRRKA